MTAAKIEQIARLMHDTWRERYEARRSAGDEEECSLPFEQMPLVKQDDYRHVARAVLRRLGH